MRTLLLRSLLAPLATTSAPAPGAPALEELGRSLAERARRLYGRSLAIRELDAGSCNGCELEIHALNNPVYDVERFGIRFVASPRHADVLLVTGPVTRNMKVALERTYAAMPAPKWVVAVGDCGCGCGVFEGSYAVMDALTSLDRDHWAEQWCKIGLAYEAKGDAHAKAGAARAELAELYTMGFD